MSIALNSRSCFVPFQCNFYMIPFLATCALLFVCLPSAPLFILFFVPQIFHRVPFVYGTFFFIAVTQNILFVLFLLFQREMLALNLLIIAVLVERTSQCRNMMVICCRFKSIGIVEMGKYKIYEIYFIQADGRCRTIPINH